MIVNNQKSNSLRSQPLASSPPDEDINLINNENFCSYKPRHTPQIRHNTVNIFSHQSQAKRLSLIDRGKSWAKQLMRLNKLSNLSPQQKSFESCDSGIDTTSSTSSTSSSINYSVSNTSKISNFSSCSFPATSSNNANNDPASSAASTSKPTLNMADHITYDPFYSSNSNSSKTSSSAYLISLVDESGYLVPIMNYPINSSENSKAVNSDRPNATPLLLTRSFSTRSAYNSSHTSNKKLMSSFISNNRATICEQLVPGEISDGIDELRECVKCNAKLKVSQHRSNGNSMSKSNTQDEDESIKVNQAYNLFESLTCTACSKSTACNTPDSTPNNSSPLIFKKQLEKSRDGNPRLVGSNSQPFLNSSIPPPPSHPPPPPPTQQQQQTPPPLPLVPPPPLSKHSINQGLAPQPCIQVAPLLICSADHDLSKANLCACNSLSVLNLNYLNSNKSFANSHSYKNDANYLKTTAQDKKNENKNSSKIIVLEEPITYIDSLDLDENNNSRKLDNTNIQGVADNMNQLIAKLKGNKQHQQNSKKNSQQTPQLRLQFTNSPCVSCSYCAKQRQSQQPPPYMTNILMQKLKEQDIIFNNKQLNQHDLSLGGSSGSDKNDKETSPTNSVGSFEFINTSHASNGSNMNSNMLNVALIASYEKSWENNPSIMLLDNQTCNNFAENNNSNNHVLLNQSQNLQKFFSQSNNSSNNGRPSRPSSLLLFDNSNSNNTSQGHRDVNFVKSYLEKCKLNPTKRQSDNADFFLSSASSNCLVKNKSSQSYRNSDNLAEKILDENSNSRRKQNITTSDEVERLLSNSSFANNNESVLTSPSSHQKSQKFNKTELDIAEPVDLEPLTETWYQPSIPREIVQSYLHNQEIGSFLIRLSTSCKNCYAMSIRVPYFANQNGIAHYLITKNSKGYKLKGVDKEFRSLRSLVTHYSVMQEILPVTLNLTSDQHPMANNNSSNNRLSTCSNQNSLANSQIFLMNSNVKNIPCLIK